jgi:hypothetical protein
VSLAHGGDQLFIVVAQLCQHVLRRDVFSVVVQHALHPRDLTDDYDQ